MNDSSNWTKHLIIIFGGLCLLGMGYWLVIDNSLNQLSDSQKLAIALRQALATKQYEVTHRMKDVENNFTNDQATIFKKISQLVFQNNLQLIAFKPLTEKTNSFLIKWPIQISLMGNYQELLALVNSINHEKHNLKIETFSIKNIGVDNAVKLEINLNLIGAGIVKSDGKTKTGINLKDDVSPNKRNPFQNDETERLESIPLHLLRMIGTLRNDDKQWALVIAPDEKIYWVMAGDFLENDGKVIEVDSDKMIIKKDKNIIVFSMSHNS